MFIPYILLQQFVFPQLMPEFFHHSTINTVLFAFSIFMSVVCWRKDPGYVSADPSLDFGELLEQFEPTCLCPDCLLIKPTRSRHCNYCNRCIERFDHHCPWINNCVGKGNFRYFIIFIFVQLSFLVHTSFLLINCMIYNIFYFTAYACNWDDIQNMNLNLNISISLTVGLLCLLFFFPLLLLCIVQSGNLMKGQTTCERFSQNRKNVGKTLSNTSNDSQFDKKANMSGVGKSGSGGCLANCLRMVCDTHITSQQEMLAEINLSAEKQIRAV